MFEKAKNALRGLFGLSVRQEVQNTWAEMQEQIQKAAYGALRDALTDIRQDIHVEARRAMLTHDELDGEFVLPTEDRFSKVNGQMPEEVPAIELKAKRSHRSNGKAK